MLRHKAYQAKSIATLTLPMTSSTHHAMHACMYAHILQYFLLLPSTVVKSCQERRHTESRQVLQALPHRQRHRLRPDYCVDDCVPCVRQLQRYKITAVARCMLPWDHQKDYPVACNISAGAWCNRTKCVFQKLSSLARRYICIFRPVCHNE